MVEVAIRNNNNIITLLADGKVPIQSSQGMIHLSANELLCSAIGSCIGRTLVIFCAHNTIDVRELEHILINLEDDIIKVYVSYPETMPIEILTQMDQRIRSCELVRKISKSFGFVLELQKNKTNTTKLKEMKSTKPCCGG